MELFCRADMTCFKVKRREQSDCTVKIPLKRYKRVKMEAPKSRSSSHLKKATPAEYKGW